MAKKKKTQLKPVARGFATTSVPKKVAPVEPEPLADSGIVQSDENPLIAETQEGQDTSKTSNIVPEVDPEQELLQAYVDKHQERTEREISRTVKVSDLCISSFPRAH